MIAWLTKIAASAAFKYIVVPLIVAVILGGGYAYVTTRAFNRGFDKGWADNTAAQKKAIAIKKEQAERGRAELDRLTPAEADAELIKRCKAACGEDALCVKACD